MKTTVIGKSHLRKSWHKSDLPVVFYHSTFIENISMILKEQRIIANKGHSICREKNGYVSLSDRLTQGIIEFFGNIVVEFDAVRIFSKNPHIIPRNYGISEDEINRYDDFPFFENEWIILGELKFSFLDINKVLLITDRHFKKPDFRDITEVLEDPNIKFYFLWEKYLPDNIDRDTFFYFTRLENWERFNKFYSSTKNEGRNL